MTETPIQILRLPHSEGLPLPAYETAGSAGMDLRAAVPEDQPMTLAPGQRVLVPTGLKIALPLGYEAQVRARSGLALKHGIICPNAPGTIDSDYRGEIVVGLACDSSYDSLYIAPGDRIAQGIIMPVEKTNFIVADELSETVRGTNGLGSTGQ